MVVHRTAMLMASNPSKRKKPLNGPGDSRLVTSSPSDVIPSNSTPHNFRRSSTKLRKCDSRQPYSIVLFPTAEQRQQRVFASEMAKGSTLSANQSFERTIYGSNCSSCVLLRDSNPSVRHKAVLLVRSLCNGTTRPTEHTNTVLSLFGIGRCP